MTHLKWCKKKMRTAELETSEIWSSGTSSSGNMYLKHLGDMTHLKWCKKKCCLLSLKHLTPEVLEPHHVKDMAAQLKQDQVERYGCWTKVDQVKEAQSTHFFKPMPMRFQANAGSFPTMQELPNQSNLGIWDFFQIVCICIYIYMYSDWNGSILYWVEPPAQPGFAEDLCLCLSPGPILPLAGSKSFFGDLKAVSVQIWL